jgi:hypothetical protein
MFRLLSFFNENAMVGAINLLGILYSLFLVDLASGRAGTALSHLDMVDAVALAYGYSTAVSTLYLL